MVTLATLVHDKAQLPVQFAMNHTADHHAATSAVSLIDKMGDSGPYFGYDRGIGGDTENTERGRDVDRRDESGTSSSGF